MTETFDDFDFIVRAQKTFAGDPCTSSDSPGCGACFVCCKADDFDDTNNFAGKIVFCQPEKTENDAEDFTCEFKESKAICCGTTQLSFKNICPTDCTCTLDENSLDNLTSPYSCSIIECGQQRKGKQCRTKSFSNCPITCR